MKSIISLPFQSILIVIATGVFLLSASGCVPSWHLQSVSVSGPLHEPALHLQRTTEQPGFRINPWQNVYTQRERLGNISGHTQVNAAGVYQVDSVVDAGGTHYYENPANTHQYQGQNFTWRLPSISGGASFDVDVSSNVSLFGGLGMSSVDNDPLWSAQAGLGYNFGTERIAGRFDAAVTWETIATQAEFVRTTDFFFSSQTEVQFFSSQNKRTRMGGYGSLTLQSTGKDFIFYTQLAFGTQAVTSFLMPSNSSGADDEYVRNLKFVSLTPGIAWSLGSYTRFVVGVRFTSDTEIRETSSPFIIAPLAQLELSF